MSRIQNIFILFGALALGLAPSSHAGGGSIPLKPNFARPATDLVDETGRILNPDEARNLADAKKLDLSTLDPDGSTNLWKNAYPHALEPSARELELAATSDGQYLATAPAPFELFKFTVQVKNALGVPEVRTVSLGRGVHNLLLRKAILQKIGYLLAPSAYVPRLTVRFADPIEKKIFVTALESATASVRTHWVVSEADDAVVLQDAVVTEDQDRIYNLAAGYLNSDIVRGRRLLSSTYVAYALANVPESVNLFGWQAGQVSSGAAVLDYPDEDEYAPSYEDARWILRRLARLDRADWETITKSISVPEPVRRLLVEKLIARRNSLVELFAVESFDGIARGKDAEPEPDVTLKPDLVKGKLTRQDWPGYACRFSFGDPDNPLNPGEMWAFAKSKFLSFVLSNAVSKLNALPFFHTADQDRVDQHQAEVFQQQLEDYEKTGQVQKTPLKTWGYGFASGELIFSREVVTGSYLGTDSLVQLADTVGLRGTGGLAVGIDGLPTAYSAMLRGKVQLSRTYTHLTPLQSVKKANRYPFKNAAVPLLIHRASRQLDPLFEEGYAKLDETTKSAVYAKALEAFKETIGVGESIIITDSLVPSASLTGSAGVGKLLEVSATVLAADLVMHRLQVYRKSENVFQIYNDQGNAFRPTFDLGLNVRKALPEFGGTAFVSDENALRVARFPILNFSWSGNRGTAKVEFFPVELSLDESDRVANIRALGEVRRAMAGGSLELLRRDHKPYTLTNRFRERDNRDSFLIFNYRRLRSAIDLTVQAPDGGAKSFVRDSFGETIGRNLEKGAEDALTFIAQLYTHAAYDFSDGTASNPGYSIFGKAKNVLLQFEAEKLDDGSLKDRFVKLSHISNGWSIDKRGAQKILDAFSKDYGGNLIPPLALHDTDKIFLYSISLNIHLYDAAIAHLLALSKDDIRRVFENDGAPPGNAVGRIATNLRQFAKNRTAKDLLRAVNIADRKLSPAAFLEFLGGKDNVFIYARIDGYRKGDENGDNPIVSRTNGLIGSAKAYGPLSDLRTKIGMTEGEFLASWITGRLL